MKRMKSVTRRRMVAIGFAIPWIVAVATVGCSTPPRANSAATDLIAGHLRGGATKIQNVDILKELFNKGSACPVPGEIWFAGPLPWNTKSAVEDLHTLRNPEFRTLGSVYYLFRGNRDAVEVYCLLAISVYPDGKRRFVKIAEAHEEFGKE